MPSIDFLFQENVAHARGLATDRYFLNAFARGSRARPGVLRVYTAPGDLISAGRFHRWSGPPTDPPIARRLSGGRTLPFGEGFLGFSLVLPHRSALVSDEPLALSPYQVPNRYARGVLAALRMLGVDAFYPGRDFVTVRRRTIGMLSFETDERGGLLFEGVLALGRDFRILPELLARADPEGRLGGEPLETSTLTSLGAEVGESVAPREAAETLRRGFAEQFRLDVSERTLTPLEEQAIGAIESREFGEAWAQSRRFRDDLPLWAIVPVPLGLFEVHLALEQDRFLREVQFAGDFIANSAAIEALERDLKLCPAEWRAVAMVTDEIFNRPENYVLGIGKLRAIPDLVVKALPS